MTTREPVSEHYSSGPLGARVQAALVAAGLARPGVSFEAFDPIDEFHVGGLDASRELARALAPESESSVLDFGSGPLPCSRTAATSHLLTMSGTIAALQTAGFQRVDAVDRTAWSLAWFAARGRSAAASPLGLQVVMGQRFAAMGLNLVMNMMAGRVGVAQIVATRAER